MSRIQPIASTSYRLLSTAAPRYSSASTLNPAKSTSTVPKTHHHITLRRSAIGLPPSSKKTLEALGLWRINGSVLHPFSPALAGKILRVKELVDVRNVTLEEGRGMLGRWRREGSGVIPEGRVFGGGNARLGASLS